MSLIGSLNIATQRICGPLYSPRRCTGRNGACAPPLTRRSIMSVEDSASELTAGRLLSLLPTPLAHSASSKTRAHRVPPVVKRKGKQKNGSWWLRSLPQRQHVRRRRAAGRGVRTREDIGRKMEGNRGSAHLQRRRQRRHHRSRTLSCLQPPTRKQCLGSGNAILTARGARKSPIVANGVPARAHPGPPAPFARRRPQRAQRPHPSAAGRVGTACRGTHRMTMQRQLTSLRWDAADCVGISHAIREITYPALARPPLTTAGWPSSS